MKRIKKNILHPYMPSKKMVREDVIREISEQYASFQKRNFTRAQALEDVEHRLETLKEKLFVLNATRNDMSSHLGNPDDLFCPEAHTHGLCEVHSYSPAPTECVSAECDKFQAFFKDLIPDPNARAFLQKSFGKSVTDLITEKLKDRTPKTAWDPVSNILNLVIVPMPDGKWALFNNKSKEFHCQGMPTPESISRLVMGRIGVRLKETVQMGEMLLKMGDFSTFRPYRECLRKSKRKHGAVKQVTDSPSVKEESV